MVPSDLSGIRHALAIAQDKGFAEVAIEDGPLSFRAVLEPRKKSPAHQAQVESQQERPAAEPELGEIRSPLVGYFRAGDTALMEGQSVEVGQVVGVVLSLGDIPYAVESAVEGEIAEVLVEPDQPVEYGQVLARVRA